MRGNGFEGRGFIFPIEMFALRLVTPRLVTPWLNALKRQNKVVSPINADVGDNGRNSEARANSTDRVTNFLAC